MIEVVIKAPMVNITYDIFRKLGLLEDSQHFLGIAKDESDYLVSLYGETWTLSKLIKKLEMWKEETKTLNEDKAEISIRVFDPTSL